MLTSLDANRIEGFITTVVGADGTEVYEYQGGWPMKLAYCDGGMRCGWQCNDGHGYEAG